MRKVMSTILYLAIILFCSIEVVPKLISSFEQKPGAVPYVAHDCVRENASETIDYKELLEKSGVLGDMKTL